MNTDADNSNGEIDEYDEKAEVCDIEDTENTQNQGDRHEAEPPLAVENTADEHLMPVTNNDEDKDSSYEPGVTITRLGRIS